MTADSSPDYAAGTAALLGEQVIGLLRQLPSTPQKLRMCAGDVSVEVEWSRLIEAGSAPGRATTTSAPGDSERAVGGGADPSPEVFVVRAPMVGTFYRSPRPGDPPFVSEGTEVATGQQLAIIEAMKLLTPVEAGHGGRIARILVADATAVEYDQPLLEIALAGHDVQ